MFMDQNWAGTKNRCWNQTPHPQPILTGPKSVCSMRLIPSCKSHIDIFHFSVWKIVKNLWKVVTSFCVSTFFFNASFGFCVFIKFKFFKLQTLKQKKSKSSKQQPGFVDTPCNIQYHEVTWSCYWLSNGHRSSYAKGDRYNPHALQHSRRCHWGLESTPRGGTKRWR